jgi:hypothetical protein
MKMHLQNPQFFFGIVILQIHFQNPKLKMHFFFPGIPLHFNIHKFAHVHSENGYFK